MRPPEFTGGKTPAPAPCMNWWPPGFNEAAGIHRRKVDLPVTVGHCHDRFNEAAGIHRRKDQGAVADPCFVVIASMRPPEFTGGKLADESLSSLRPNLLQ